MAIYQNVGVEEGYSSCEYKLSYNAIIKRTIRLYAIVNRRVDARNIR